MPETTSLKVTVDKSHIVTIGERLYGESVELVRELVNNAYDADATEVRINILEDAMTVQDNGTGMDLEGLKQYFNIGSQQKLAQNKSERLNRDRIGQFGIGKFAALTAAKTFEVETQKGDFRARATFDKDSWQASQDSWELPLTLLKADPQRGNGTTLTLTHLTKKFDKIKVEQRLIESVPLMDPNFDVFLDGYQVLPRRYQGKKIPILEGTPFGIIHGEMILLPASSASTLNLGIDVKVKKVTVKRELFGMETWGRAMTRLRGEIHADFLPVTSDRSGFVLDSEEYKMFYEIMNKVMAEVKKMLTHLSDTTQGRKASRVLKDALERIKHSLSVHPEISPFGPIPLADEGGIGGSGLIAKKKEKKLKEELVGENPSDNSARDHPKQEKKPTVQSLSPQAIVKKVKLGQLGVSCCIDNFGSETTECFTENSIIYINRDHPLYKREENRPQTFTLHITRLLAQEIALMTQPPTPREAFERQSRLLKDALSEDA
ncbi:MAG: ATP-binding protein [Chlamydiae bacterium]|nr:ATP-binding protein [Chlamydiota bacterium]MBI3265651.1 ATP-binding protein [Chlamydiota bacterium]